MQKSIELYLDWYRGSWCWSIFEEDAPHDSEPIADGGGHVSQDDAYHEGKRHFDELLAKSGIEVQS